MAALSFEEFTQKYHYVPVIDDDDVWLRIWQAHIQIDESEKILRLSFDWNTHYDDVSNTSNKYVKEVGIAYADGIFYDFAIVNDEGEEAYRFEAGLQHETEEYPEKIWEPVGWCNTKYGIELVFVARDIQYTSYEYVP